MKPAVGKTLQIAIPIILGNMSQMLLGLIDSAMVGSIHSTHLAASSLVNSVIAVPMVMGIGMTMAISPLVAAAEGVGNKIKPLRILYNGFYVSTIIAIVMGIILHFGSGIVYHLGQDHDVAVLAESYLQWMAWSMIPMTCFLAIKQFADGLEKTKWPLIFSLLAIPINVLINYMFIFGKWGAPRMELDGAGVGTMTSRIFIFLGLGWYIFKSDSFAEYRTNLSEQLVLKKRRINEVLRLGIPSSLQFGMEVAAFAMSGIMVGWLGSEQQAAHQIALGIASMTFMASMGLSAAGSIRVGNAYGRKAWSEARTIGVNIVLMGIVYGVACGIVFILFRNQLPYIFNDEKIVVGYAAILLMYAAFFQISDSVQAILIGLLRGIQDVMIPTIIVALSYWVIGIPVGYFLAFNLGMESSGVWLGFVIALSLSAGLNLIRFLKLTKKSSRVSQGN